jgi:hypothetical protein
MTNVIHGAGSIDIVSEHDAAGCDLTGKDHVDRFDDKSFSKIRVVLALATTNSLNSLESGILGSSFCTAF